VRDTLEGVSGAIMALIVGTGFCPPAGRLGEPWRFQRRGRAAGASGSGLLDP